MLQRRELRPDSCTLYRDFDEPVTIEPLAVDVRAPYLGLSPRDGVAPPQIASRRSVIGAALCAPLAAAR